MRTKDLLPFLLGITLFCCGSLRAQNMHAKLAEMPIDTSLLLKVNGVDQYLEIKGASRTKPVLLFIHGGPCWPSTPMLRKFNQDLTRDFVLVSWDQRNCGKSATDSTIQLTPDLYVQDAHQVTQYLKAAFHTRKIFVICHSWGSVIGLYLISEYPEDYAAYIGMGQSVSFNKSEDLAIRHVAEEAKLNNDTVTLNGLKEISFTEQDGYKNGIGDALKLRKIGAKYLTNKDIPELPDQTKMYSDYSKLDWTRRS